MDVFGYQKSGDWFVSTNSLISYNALVLLSHALLDGLTVLKQ
jgi:hypothetical protein